jgi:hypothetical protein
VAPLAGHDLRCYTPSVPLPLDRIVIADLTHCLSQPAPSRDDSMNILPRVREMLTTFALRHGISPADTLEIRCACTFA